MGAFPIRGLDMAAWDDGSDLIAIKPRNTPDPLSIWLTNAFFPFLHRVLGERFKVSTHTEPSEVDIVLNEIPDARISRARRGAIRVQRIPSRLDYKHRRHRRGLSVATRLYNRALLPKVQRVQAVCHRHLLRLLLASSVSHDQRAEGGDFCLNRRVSSFTSPSPPTPLACMFQLT